MAELIVKIGATSKDFQDELEKLKKKSKELSGQLESAAKISAAAFVTLGGVIAFSAKAAHEAEEASHKLSQALKLQGVNAEELQKKYEGYAEAIEAKTGADDVAITRGLALMQSFLGQTEISKELTQAVVDLSAGLGVDLETAFEKVARSIGTNTNALAKNGIEIDTHATKQQKIAQVIEQINGLWGGQAEAQVQGLGQMKLLSAAFEDFTKALGKEFAPVLTQLIINLKSFFQTLSQNEALIEVISKAVFFGTVLAAMVGGLSTAGIAWIQFTNLMGAAQKVMAATTVATRVMLGATGIGLIVVVLGALFVDWSRVWPMMLNIFSSFANSFVNIMGGIAEVLKGVFTLDPDRIRKGIAEIKDASVKGAAEIVATWKGSDQAVLEGQKKTQDEQLARQKAHNERMREEQAAAEARAMATRQAERELASMQAKEASKDLIALKRQEVETLKQIEDDKNKGIRETLTTHLAEIRMLITDQQIQDTESKRIFDEQIMTMNREFYALSAEEQRIFLEKHGAQLTASINTQAETRRLAALQEANEQIAAHNRFLENERKYGTAYATLQDTFRNREFQNMRTGMDELVQLQESNQAHRKQIGKAFAMTHVVLKTVESAMNIWAGFSTIPIVGPALAGAAIAALIGFKGEQLSQIAAANTGGIIPGLGPDADSTLSFLTPGELVVPRKSFDEVVNAVAMNRMQNGASLDGGSAPSGGGVAEIVLSLKDDLMDFIEAQIVQRRNLNLSVQGA